MLITLLYIKYGNLYVRMPVHIDRLLFCLILYYSMTNTALGYQMMIENHLLSAMVSAESRYNYYIACAYAITYAKFLKITDIPQKPMDEASAIAQNEKWMIYYFKLLTVIVEKMSTNLTEVRIKYNKRFNTPQVIPSQ